MGKFFYIITTSILISSLFNLQATDRFIETESFDGIQRFPYDKEDETGWFAREFSCRTIPAPGMSWATLIFSNASEKSMVKKISEPIPPGKYKIFLRVLYHEIEKQHSKVLVKLGGEEKQISWSSIISDKPDKKGKIKVKKGFGWVGGVNLDLKKAATELTITALDFGGRGYGVLYNPLNSFICIDTVYISNNNDEVPDIEQERMIRAGIAPMELEERPNYISDDVGLYDVRTPAPIENPITKPILLKSFDGRKNLWPNASFELGMNDAWASDSVDKYHIFTDKDLDREKPFHGTYCLRVPEAVSIFSRPYFLPQSGNFTFGIYVRGHGNVNFEIQKMLNMDYKAGKPFDFKAESILEISGVAGDSWKRFSATQKLTEGWYFLSVKAQNQIWLDAISLEEGDSTSEFKPRAVLEGAIRSGQLGNVIYNDEQKTLDLWFHNSSDKPLAAELDYKIINHQDSVVTQATTKPTIVPSQETIKTKIQLPALNGIFSILFAVNGREFPEGETVYTAMPTPPKDIPRHQLGANINYCEDVLAAHARAGFRWVLTCKSRQIVEGKYKNNGSFDYQDHLAAMPAKYGLKLFPNFWPTKFPKSLKEKVPGTFRPIRNFDGRTRPKLDVWEDYVIKAVTHYRPWVKVWCIEDEMEYSGWDPKLILPLLEKTCDIVKKVAPDIELGISGDPDYVEELFALGFDRKSFEWLGASQFDYDYWKSDKARHMKERYNKKMCSYGVGGRPPADSMYHTRYAYYPMGGKILHMARQVIKYCLVQDIDILGHYASIIRNDGVHKNINKPLFDWEGSLIPWGATFAIIGNHLANAIPLETIQLANSNRLVHLFEIDGKLGGCTYSINVPREDMHWRLAYRVMKDVSLQFEKDQIKVLDMYFNPRKDIVWDENGLKLDITQEPVFFISESMDLKEFIDAFKNAKIPARQIEAEFAYSYKGNGQINLDVKVINNSSNDLKNVIVDLRFPDKTPWCVTAEQILPVPVTKINEVKAGQYKTASFRTLIDSNYPAENIQVRANIVADNNIEAAFDDSLWLLPSMFMEEEITIDGKFTEWKQQAAWLAYEWNSNNAGRGVHQLYENGRYFSYPPFRLDARAAIRTGYDDENLYFAIQLEDDQPILDRKDGEEIKIILNNNMKETVISMNPLKNGDVDCNIFFNDKLIKQLKEAKCRTIKTPIFNGTDLKKEVARFVTIEVAIPWSLLGDRPADNSIIGFDLLWTDIDMEDGKPVHGTLRWAGEAKKHGYIIMQNIKEAKMDKQNNYDWVIFDYGGTLDKKIDNPSGDRTDISDRYGKIILEWFKKQGYSVNKTSSELQKLTEMAHNETPGSPGQISVSDNIDYYSKWILWIYRQAGITKYIPHTELERARLYIMEQAIKKTAVPPSDDIMNTLKALKKAGVKMGVLSNNNGYVEDMVANAKLRDFFEFIVDSARIGIRKPDRRIFDYTVKKYGLAGKRLLYVGDSYKHDVIGVMNTEIWDVAWLRDEKNDDETLSSKRLIPISNFNDLLQIVL